VLRRALDQILGQGRFPDARLAIEEDEPPST
jgi:hypothetical protein